MAMLNVPETFRNFLKLLNSGEIEYMVVGGYAVILHGYTRYTGDFDIWINTTECNVERLTEVVREFGFDVPELRKEIFLKSGQVIRMGHPPLRIEIITTIDGVRFEECYSRRLVRDLDGLPVPFISARDLITNKEASARFKDLDDAEKLRKIHG